MSRRARIFAGVWLLALALSATAEANGFPPLDAVDSEVAIIWLTALAAGVALLAPERKGKP